MRLGSASMIYLLVLHADQLDPLHVLDAAQLQRNLVGITAQRGEIVAVAGQREDVDLHIAELVIGKWPVHAGRQGVA